MAQAHATRGRPPVGGERRREALRPPLALCLTNKPPKTGAQQNKQRRVHESESKHWMDKAREHFFFTKSSRSQGSLKDLSEVSKPEKVPSHISHLTWLAVDSFTWVVLRLSPPVRPLVGSASRCSLKVCAPEFCTRKGDPWIGIIQQQRPPPALPGGASSQSAPSGSFGVLFGRRHCARAVDNAQCLRARRITILPLLAVLSFVLYPVGGPCIISTRRLQVFPIVFATSCSLGPDLKSASTEIAGRVDHVEKAGVASSNWRIRLEIQGWCLLRFV